MNHLCVLLLFLFASIPALGQPLAPPLLGWVRDAGQWRAIHGIAGNFITDAPILGGVVSGGFSGRAGAIKTDTEIITFDGSGEETQRWAAPAGPGLFAFDGLGRPALCYLPNTKQLLDLRKAEAEARDLSGLSGTVLAVGTAGDDFRMLVAREGALWLTSGSSGEQLLAGLPANGPALLLHDGSVVAAAGATLFIRRGLTGDQELALPAAAQELEQLGEGWVRVGQPGGAPPLALQLTKEGVRIYRLPAVEVQP